MFILQHIATGIQEAVAGCCKAKSDLMIWKRITTKFLD